MKRSIIAIAAALLALVTVSYSSFSASATNRSLLALTGSNLSALDSPSTALTVVPTSLHAPAPAYGAKSGTVHLLGHGAFAWRLNNQVCWSFSVGSGCADPSTAGAEAIDPTLADSDTIRSGAPATVSGLAVDDVASVTATLSNGSAYSTTPTANWFVVVLPATAAPWDVIKVTARLKSGGSVVKSFHLQAPSPQ